MRIIFFTSILFYFVHMNVCSVGVFEGIPERPVIEFYNKSYISFIKIDIRKPNRQSPYMIGFEIEILSGAGNNVTIDLMVLEYLSSGYQPTPIAFKIKLCDIFNKESFLGQIATKQLPAAWSCPFKIGRYSATNITLYLDDYPYKLPFTWSSVSIKTRADVNFFLTGTKICLLTYKIYVTVHMKPAKKFKKMETSTPPTNILSLV